VTGVQTCALPILSFSKYVAAALAAREDPFFTFDAA
jgi:hypothetical protein